MRGLKYVVTGDCESKLIEMVSLGAYDAVSSLIHDYCGHYADDNSWNSGVRQIYSEFAYDDVTAEYTNYVKGLERDIFENNARE